MWCDFLRQISPIGICLIGIRLLGSCREATRIRSCVRKPENYGARAMARRRPWKYHRKVDAATPCSGVCPHTSPDLRVYMECFMFRLLQVFLYFLRGIVQFFSVLQARITSVAPTTNARFGTMARNAQSWKWVPLTPLRRVWHLYIVF